METNLPEPKVFDSYQSIVERLLQMENRAWATLNNFLVANAFILVAWATAYKEKGEVHADGFGGVDWVLFSLSAVGYFGGLQWGLIGGRNWRYVRQFEADLKRMATRAPEIAIVEEIVAKARDSIRGVNADSLGISYNHWVLSGTPILISIVYLVSFVILCRVRHVEGMFEGIGIGMALFGLLYASVGTAMLGLRRLK